MFTKRELLTIIKGLTRGIDDCESVLISYQRCEDDPKWAKVIKDTKEEIKNIKQVRTKALVLWKKVGEE